MYNPSGCSEPNNPKASYACSDQMAWFPDSRNKNFAYGFAAAHLGVDEKRTCCTCLQLSFKEALAGKRMIVQVTNTGGDLSSRQIDLAFAGGGEGLFTGCSSRYGNYQGGERYGGVSSINDCQKLPTQQLREGCRVRFDLFGDISNPPVDYVEVECPQALIDRSGCTRA